MQKPGYGGWVSLVVVMLCVAAVATMGVTSPGLWISQAAARRGAHEYWTALHVLSHVGAVAIGVLACFVPVRLLGVITGGCYALLMALAVATGHLNKTLFLPLAAITGALRICLWALLFEQILALDRHLRNAAFVLAGTLASVAYLFASQALAPLFFAMSQHFAFVMAAMQALLVVMAIAAFRSPQTGSTGASSSPRTRWIHNVALLFLLSLPVEIGTAAIVSSLIDPNDLSAFRSWLRPVAVLLGQGGVFALLAWVGIRRRETATMTLASLGMVSGAALSPISLLSSPILHSSWGPELTFVVGLGSGIVALSTTLPFVLAGVLTPRRLVPLVLACWFIGDALASRLANAVAHWARGDTARCIALTLAASLLMAGSGVAAWVFSKREPFRCH